MLFCGVHKLGIGVKQQYIDDIHGFKNRNQAYIDMIDLEATKYQPLVDSAKHHADSLLGSTDPHR